jgi:hypothetical protein
LNGTGVLKFELVLGGYQLWNIPGGTGIESLQKQFMAAWMVLVVLDFFLKKTFIPGWSLVSGPNSGPWF